MTEAEYKSLPRTLEGPIYDEGDSRCERIDRPTSPSYAGVREATNTNEAMTYFADPSLLFRGGIRYQADGGETSIYAYFWVKR